MKGTRNLSFALLAASPTLWWAGSIKGLDFDAQDFLPWSPFSLKPFPYQLTQGLRPGHQLATGAEGANAFTLVLYSFMPLGFLT